MIKQIDTDYDIDKATDERIKLTREEWHWLPGPCEIWNSIPRPKDWEFPERLAGAEAVEREIQAIMDKEGLSYGAAWHKYRRAKGFDSDLEIVD
jgi:hypothetical protein